MRLGPSNICEVKRPKVRRRLGISALLFAAIASANGLAVSACSKDSEDIAQTFPKGFPSPKTSAVNPDTPEKVELGRYLFYDERLSGNETQSCSSCHLQHLAFTDGKSVAIGSTGEAHPRNSPTLTNVAYNATLTWANPLLTELESQIRIPIFGEFPVELGVAGNTDEVLTRFASDPVYQELHASAFPLANGIWTWDHVIYSLSSFSRSLISGDSPFDRFVYGDQVDALSDGAKRGMVLFYSERLECHHCHGGFNFTESSIHENSVFEASRFHNTGLYNITDSGGHPEKGNYPPNNTGLYELTDSPKDMGRFRPPTLRNVEVTGPYMHDGSVPTLGAVIDIYAAGGRVIESGAFAGDGRKSPWKSGLVPGFEITEEEKADLVEFLKSLTDETFLENDVHNNPFASAGDL